MDKITKTVTRESDKFMLRLPQGMRETIATSAKENGRSMNAEIVARLEQSFQQPATNQNIDELVSEAIDKRMKKIINAPGKSIAAKMLHAFNSEDNIKSDK